MTGIIGGAVLMTTPLIVFATNVLRVKVILSYTRSSGIGDPAGMSRQIEAVITTTAISMVACAIGIVMLIVSLVLHFRKRP